nr:hypothetical protein [Tanacetum cinerariifolium]
MEDQPLPADASPTVLSSGYVVNSKDEKDPKEDPAYYHTDRGNNEDDESSNDDDDDDDVKKDEEDKKEEEHPAGFYDDENVTNKFRVTSDDLRGALFAIYLIFAHSIVYFILITCFPLPADASPTALSSGYVIDYDSEEDEEDPKEDPANYPTDGRDNDDESSDDDDDDDDESSDDDDDDDDVEKDKEEHLAPTDPFVVSTNDHVPLS